MQRVYSTLYNIFTQCWVVWKCDCSGSRSYSGTWLVCIVAAVLVRFNSWRPNILCGNVVMALLNVVLFSVSCSGTISFTSHYGVFNGQCWYLRAGWLMVNVMPVHDIMHVIWPFNTIITQNPPKTTKQKVYYPLTRFPVNFGANTGQVDWLIPISIGQENINFISI